MARPPRSAPDSGSYSPGTGLFREETLEEYARRRDVGSPPRPSPRRAGFATWRRFGAIALAVSAISVAAAQARASAPGSSPGRLALTVGGGWSLYEMSTINDGYIGGFARPYGILKDDVDDGPTVLTELGYRVLPRVSVDLGVWYARGRTALSSVQTVTNGTGSVTGNFRLNLSLTNRLVAPHLRVRYHVPRGRFDFAVGGGGALLFGKAHLESHSNADSTSGFLDTDQEYTGDGVGILASGSATYRLDERTGIGVETGFRRFKTEQIKNDQDEKWVVEAAPGMPTLDLDFSGFYLLGTLLVRL